MKLIVEMSSTSSSVNLKLQIKDKSAYVSSECVYAVMCYCKISSTKASSVLNKTNACSSVLYNNNMRSWARLGLQALPYASSVLRAVQIAAICFVSRVAYSEYAMWVYGKGSLLCLAYVGVVGVERTKARHWCHGDVLTAPRPPTLNTHTYIIYHAVSHCVQN